MEVNVMRIAGCWSKSMTGYNRTIKTWCVAALPRKSGSVSVVLADDATLRDLNRTFRGKDKPTNVLAFPSDIPAHIAYDYPFLGDVIICPAVLLDESVALHKPLTAHWALIVIHGILHLLGYDHIEDHDATVMQALEIKLLAQLGFDNPYKDHDIELE